MEYYFAFLGAQSIHGERNLTFLQQLQLSPVPTHPPNDADDGWTNISSSDVKGSPSASPDLNPESALLLLATRDFCEKILVELQELNAFVASRASQVLSRLSVSDAAATLTTAVTLSGEELEACSVVTNKAISLLRDPVMRKWLLVKESPATVNRSVSGE